MMPQGLLTLLLVGLTLLSYLFSRFLSERFRHPLLNVVVLGAAGVIAVLLLAGLPYESYAPAQEIMGILLGPATVSLAVPLYRYRRLLVRAAPAILGSVAVGSFISMATASFMAIVLGLPESAVIPIMVKGVSMPFAVELVELYKADPALASVFVMMAGILGAFLGAWTLNAFGLKEPMGRGLALGTIAHAQGIVAALPEGELPGSMAGLAMILTGIFTAVFFPVMIWILKLLNF